MTTAAASTLESTSTERFLLVRSGETQVAIPIASVRRVLRTIRVFPVPGSRPELLGLLQYGGEPVPVVDLGHLLGGGPEHHGGELAVVLKTGGRDGGELVALAVHEALAVVTLDPRSMTPSEQRLLRGEVVRDGARVRVFEPRALTGPRP